MKRSSPKHCQAVLKQLNEQRLSNQFCDVTLLIEGEEYKAHKSVLSANSEYFRDLFIEKGAVSSHEAVVDLSGKNFLIFLFFVNKYTGRGVCISYKLRFYAQVREAHLQKQTKLNCKVLPFSRVSRIEL